MILAKQNINKPHPKIISNYLMSNFCLDYVMQVLYCCVNLVFMIGSVERLPAIHRLSQTPYKRDLSHGDRFADRSGENRRSQVHHNEPIVSGTEVVAALIDNTARIAGGSARVIASVVDRLVKAGA